jgi:hypothetical protein
LAPPAPRHTEQVRRGSGTVGDIMDRVTVECMCRVAASLQEVRESVRARDPALYLEVKDYIFDAFERMGILCDCAPARLVEGRVDDIMANL